jgi:hypothetical protein
MSTKMTKPIIRTFTLKKKSTTVIKIEIKMRNERHRFLRGNPYGKNHRRTKAYFHYDGGVLQERDDRPSLVRLLGYIYEGNIQESLEDKKTRYTRMHRPAYIKPINRIWITLQQSPQAYSTLTITEYGSARYISTKLIVQTSQPCGFSTCLSNCHILSLGSRPSNSRLQNCFPTHSTTTNGENITCERSSLVQITSIIRINKTNKSISRFPKL